MTAGRTEPETVDATVPTEDFGADASLRDRSNIGIAIAAAIGLSIRLLQVATVTGKKVLSGDAYYYFQQATQFNAGHGFVQPLGAPRFGIWMPGADHPPGFVGLLIALQRLGLRTPLSEQYFMAVMGTLTVVLIGLTARRLLGGRAGVIAALIAAVYPNLWVNDGLLMSESLFIFGFASSVYAVFRFRDERRWRWLVLTAAAMTVASSARPESLLLFPLVLVPAVFGASGLAWRRRLGMVTAAAVLPIAVFLPWTLYNLGRFEKPVYLSTGFGQTLLQGNCDHTYRGKFIGFYSLNCLWEVIPPDSSTPRDKSVDDVIYRKHAIAYMKDHAGRIPMVVLAREGRIWGVYRISQQAGLDHYYEDRGSLNLVRWQQRSWWILGLLSLPGLYFWKRRGRVLYPLTVQVGITAFITAITFGNTRYRAGVEVVVVLLATATIDQVVRLVRRGIPHGSEPAAGKHVPTESVDGS